MLDGLLPIGSVVLLKNSSRKVMTIGVCQKQIGTEEVIWDYAGCIYPEGYLGAEETFLFNNDQIDKIFSVGYQDEEQFSFKERVDQIMKEIREEEKERAAVSQDKKGETLG